LSLVAAVSAACNASPPAASVQGTSVTRSQLDSLLSEISQNAYAQCALELQGVNLPQSLTGAGQDTVSSDLASFELSTLVLQRLVDQDLARRGHPVTTADVTNARADLASQLTPGASNPSPCPGGLGGQQLVARLPGAFRSQQVSFLAAQEQLLITLGHVSVSRSTLAAYYAAHPAQFQEVCLSDVAVQTQAQAQAIYTAITSGAASFAAEAEQNSQNSIDSQTAADGGQIPCVPSSEIVNSVILGAIVGLAPGQISPPVFENTSATGGSGGVWFVLELDGRPGIPFSQAEPQIRQQLLSAQNAKVTAEFGRITKSAHVTVDPRYGSWSPAQGILPPKTPPAVDLLSRTADVPAGSGAASGVSG
jgi:hypothetical protein